MKTINPKPLGIVLIVVYSIVSGLVGLLSSISSLSLFSIFSVSIFVYLVFIVVFASSIFLLASVYGLWTYQSWGLNLTLLLYAISIPLSIIMIFPILPGSSITTENTTLQLINIAISFAVLFYLLRLDIAFLFEKQKLPRR